MRILMAEDDVNIVTIAKVALEKIGGHEVVVVNDGEAALEKISNELFDVVLLDEMMPKMNGRDVFKQYLAAGEHDNLVIFMSANHRDLDKDPLTYPEIGYIGKPFDPMTLSTQIESILFNHKVKKEAV